MDKLNINAINKTQPFKPRKGLLAFLSGDTIALQLYDTVILIKNNHYIKLNTGGFSTNHTKNCMNDNLPTGFKVYQKDFEWYVETPLKTLIYKDYMIIDTLTSEVTYDE